MEVKWIKITTDIFDNDKIKLIEKLPEGDTMLIIWLKLLILAGKKNDCGMIYITRDIPFTSDTLSDVFNRDSKVVMLALNTFVSFGMIKIFDKFIQIVNWERYQNIEGMERLKLQWKEASKKYRDKKLTEGKNHKTSYDSHTTDKIRLDKNRIDKNIYIIFPDIDNIKITQKEYDKLNQSYSKQQIDYMVKYLACYKVEKSYKTKSDYLTLLRWVAEACQKKADFPKGDAEQKPIVDMSDMPDTIGQSIW